MSFYNLLSKVDQKDFTTFCNKAFFFFGSLTSTTSNTGFLTNMLNCRKKHIRDFVGRDDLELKYLAGLNTFRAFSSMNSRRGLPKQAQVDDMLSWPEWQGEDAPFNTELFHTFSSMNRSQRHAQTGAGGRYAELARMARQR